MIILKIFTLLGKKEKGEIKVFYALNENTREEDYNKKEPLK